MPALSYSTSDFVANTLIKSADVNSNFTAIKTLLNTTGLDDTNLAAAGITRATKLKVGTAGAVLVNANSTGAMSELVVSSGSLLLGAGSSVPTVLAGSVAGRGLMDSGSAWAAYVIDGPLYLQNYGLASSVAANALTIALKDKSGADASATSPVRIGFRSSTAATGTYVQRTVTAALSLVVTSTATLGSISAMPNWVYVYAIDNAGTVELAVSGSKFVDEGTLYNTTIMNASATDKFTIYSTTARSGVAVRLIGRIKSTQATAGTWVTTPSEVSLAPFEVKVPRSEIWLLTGNGFGSGSTKIRRFTTTQKNVGSAMTYTTSADTSVLGSVITINEDGIYTISYEDLHSSATTLGASLNSAQLTTALSVITRADRILMSCCQAGQVVSMSATLYLAAGAVIRPHSDGFGSGTTDASFRIVKVSD